MATNGSLPTAFTFGTWLEDVEVWSADDDTLYNFSGVTEITLQLRDQHTKFVEMTLSMSNGDITLPSPGIIQWRAEAGQMMTLSGGLYDIIITLEDDTDTIPLVFGPVSIVE